MKYYTLEEVAEELEITRDKVLKLITGEENDSGSSIPLLFPTIYFSKPVQVRHRIDGPEWVDESVTGYFEVDGLYDTERDFLGYWQLSFGGKSRVMLSQNGSNYLLAQEKRVRESDLLVSDEELTHWKEMRGISDERDVAPSEEPTDKDKLGWAKTLASSMSARGKARKDVALALQKQGLTKEGIGLVLWPDPEVSRSGYEKRADALLGLRGKRKEEKT